MHLTMTLICWCITAPNFSELTSGIMSKVMGFLESLPSLHQSPLNRKKVVFEGILSSLKNPEAIYYCRFYHSKVSMLVYPVVRNPGII